MATTDVIRHVESELRKNAIGVEEFCGRVGIHRATWQRWKAGKTFPNAPEIARIIHAARMIGLEIEARAFIEAA